MTYNPTNNTVHIAAKSLLQVFEEAYQVIRATRSAPFAQSHSDTENHKCLKISAAITQRPLTTYTGCVSPVSNDDVFTSNNMKHTDISGSDVESRNIVLEDGEPANLTTPTTSKSTRRSALDGSDSSTVQLKADKALKRALNIAAKHAKHRCRSCHGRKCVICHQGCLSHEPVLLVCTGSNCLGAKIRKG